MQRGECLTLNTGEFPNEESVSILSEVLEMIVPQKYCLSPTACKGILRRAERRGKELPPILKEALESIATLDVSPTLRAETHNHLPIVIQPACYDARGNGDGSTCPTITGDHNSRITDYSAVIVQSAEFHGQNSITAANVELRQEQCPTLTTKKNADVIYSLQGSMIGREDKNGPQGDGINENVSFTLNTTDRHGVVYAIDRAAFNQGKNVQYDFEITDSGINSTIVAKGPSAVAYKTPPFIKWIVRRLIPLECERLQGYPDYWTVLKKVEDMSDEDYSFFKGVFLLDKQLRGKAANEPTKQQIIKWYNSLDNDGARYRMLGNSLAIPCALRVIGYMADYIRKEQTNEPNAKTG